jgi:cytidine deaminase
MAEFCPPSLEVLLVGDGETKTLRLSELLPFGFTKDHF